MSTSVSAIGVTLRSCVHFVLGALVAFASVYLLVPATINRFEINFDEGGNLAKAVLLGKGYSLYGDVWSDQPPLYTLMLAKWFAWFGVHLGTARLLSMISGAVLLTALYKLIRIRRSALTSLVGAAMLLFSTKFLLFSSAAMIGIPALMWGVLGLLLCEYYHQRSAPASSSQGSQHGWLLLLASGICLGCGIMTKLYIVVLVPAYGVSLLLGACALHSNPTLRDSLPTIGKEFLLCCVGICIAIAVIGIVGTPELVGAAREQLIRPHRSVMGFSEFAGMKRDFSAAVLRERWYVAAALICFPYLMWNRKWHVCIPAMWAICVAVLFYHHFPIWEHYYPLLAAPLGWIIVEGLAEALQQRAKGDSCSTRFPFGGYCRAALRYGTICMSLMALRSLPHRAKVSRAVLPAQTQAPIDGALLNVLRELPEQRLLTDSPLYAILSNKAINPDFAVTSQKRLHAISGQEHLSLESRIKDEQPELILIKRFPGLLEGVSKDIWTGYRVAYQRGRTKLFVKNSAPFVPPQ
jgi:hypothetical protein